MAKVRGTGISSVNYPTGMNLGGDPTQALIHMTTTGTFVISLASADLGQGLKTVLAQIGAEALGVPMENVLIDTGDTDTGPSLHGHLCQPHHASRGQRHHHGRGRGEEDHAGNRRRRAGSPPR